VALDGDSTLPLQIHVVQQLSLHLTLIDGSCKFKKTIGQGTFSVVDVGNDAEVANVFHLVEPETGWPSRLFFGHNVFEPIQIDVRFRSVVGVITGPISISVTISVTIGFEIVKTIKDGCKIPESVYSDKFVDVFEISLF
jgi:hypothetical protein